MIIRHNQHKRTECRSRCRWPRQCLAAWHDRYHSSPTELLLSASSAHTNTGHIFPHHIPSTVWGGRVCHCQNSTSIFGQEIIKLIPKIQFWILKLKGLRAYNPVFFQIESDDCGSWNQFNEWHKKKYCYWEDIYIAYVILLFLIHTCTRMLYKTFLTVGYSKKIFWKQSSNPTSLFDK